MNITTLTTQFGPGPLNFLTATQAAQQGNYNDTTLIIGAAVIIVTTVVVTILVYRKMAEQHQFKVVRKPVGIQEHFRG